MRTGTFVVGAVIAAQVVVPGIALARAPSHFGFQMFSGLDQVEVRVADNAGRDVEVNAAEHVARFRGDVNWTRHLPEHLCMEEAVAATVTVVQPGRSREFRCP